MSVLPFLSLDGSLRPVSPEGEAVCEASRGRIIHMEYLTPRRLHTREQQGYYWATVVPTVAQVWTAKMGWTAPEGSKQLHDAVHDALVRAVFGEVETPLGRGRLSSSTLTVEQYSELIEWAQAYLQKFGVHLPGPREVPA